ncbi:MAG: hypothetical protein AMXMBFR64_38970 [Myxococcales bacterium]
MTVRYFATCPKGIEPMLRDECREAGLRRVKQARGGVHFEGTARDGMRACLWLRTAHRVLWPLGSFACPDTEALYAGIVALPWEQHLTPRHTLAITALGTNEALRHTGFIAQRSKDAIVDRLRDRAGGRPSVELHEPDVRIVVHLDRTLASVSLDLSGDGLHRRGWRAASVEAPLRETLAAAIVRATGWDRVMPLVDPLCGGATIPIEAALLARRLAPGLDRAHGFLRWPTFGDVEKAAWRELCDEARAAALPAAPAVIMGVDRDPEAMEAARRNVRAAGVEGDVELSVGDGANLMLPQAPGLIVTNPPYGERLGRPGRPMQDFFRRLGTGFARYKGYTAWILSGNEEFPRHFGLRWTNRLPLWNGPLPCNLFRYEL